MSPLTVLQKSMATVHPNEGLSPLPLPLSTTNRDLLEVKSGLHHPLKIASKSAFETKIYFHL